MNWMLIVVVAATVVASQAGLWWLGRRGGPSWLRRAERRRVLVQTVDGQTIDGRLVEADEGGVVLSPAKLEGGVQMAGQAWIPRERVAWVQQPPEDGG